MGTLKNMSKNIGKTPLVSNNRDDDDSFGVHLTNLKKKSLGHYYLDKNEVIVFLPKDEFFIFKLGNILYVKESEDPKFTKRLESKNIIFENSTSLVFNKPTKENTPILFNRVLSCCNKKLDSTYALEFANKCEDLDKKTIKRIKINKEKDEDEDTETDTKEESKIKLTKSKSKKEEEKNSKKDDKHSSTSSSDEEDDDDDKVSSKKSD